MKEFTASWYDQRHFVKFEDELWQEHRKYRMRLTRRLKYLYSQYQLCNPNFAHTVLDVQQVLQEVRGMARIRLFIPPLDVQLAQWQTKQEGRAFQWDRMCRASDMDNVRVPREWWNLGNTSAEILAYRRGLRQIRKNEESSYWTWLTEVHNFGPPMPTKLVGAPFRFLSIDDDGNLRYWDRWEDVGDRKRWKTMSIGKFWRRMKHKYSMNLTDEFIDKFSEMLGGLHGDDEYWFEFKSGHDIISTYREAHFGSCMYRSSAIDVYARTDNLQIMRILANDKLVGRALVWKTECGRTVLDRVYPSDGGSHIDAAMDYARQRGWVYKVHHSIGGRLNESGTFTVRIPEADEYPYMDTFMYTDGPYDGVVRLNNSEGDYELTSTDGRAPWSGDLMYCEYMGCDYPTDEMTWVASVDMFVSHDGIERYFITDLNGEYIEESNAQRIDNTGEYFDYRSPPSSIVYNEYTDQYYDADYSDVGPATAGRCEGEYFYTIELVEIDGEFYWEQDPELPEEESDEEE